MIPYETVKRHIRFIIIGILAVATIIPFFLRTDSFGKERPLTFDEYIYSVLGLQLSKDPLVYNTQSVYKDELRKGRKLPNYFRAPLFKHPPLFPYCIAVSCRLFGPTFYSAFKVSLFFGVLLIPLAYLLSMTLFSDRITALIAALIMSIEPISMICSQKIWMESTLAFFIILSLYLFARAVKSYHPAWVILSGFVVGCAALTKYPGIFALGIILIYSICYERWLFRKRAFWINVFIPFAMLGLWFYWNYRVYGANFFSAISGMHKLYRLLRAPSQEFLFVSIIAIAAVTSLILLLKRGRVKMFLLFGCAAALLLITRAHIVNSLSIRYVPAAGWKMAMFALEPWYFYIGRMMELSPFYILSFLCMFLFAVDLPRTKAYSFLSITVSTYLIFYIYWRNYQSRYIICLTVPLVILAAVLLRYMWGRIEKIPRRSLRLIAMIVFFAGVFFFAAKTIYIDLRLAVPNSVCYF